MNYRELSVLSPIKLYSQITRKSTLYSGRIGHFEMKGTFSKAPNFEFAEMAYGGMLSIFYQRGDSGSFNKKKVTVAFNALRKKHPLLARYELPNLTYALVNYHFVQQGQKYIGTNDNNWKNNALFAMDDTNPQATDVVFNDLIIGENEQGKAVTYSHPAIMALIFPYLFTECKGHYSMVSRRTPEFFKREGIYAIPEEHGGAAKATLDGEILASYARTRLLCRDRRFARDPLFLFFLLDCIEKEHIASANRLVVTTKGRQNLQQRDVVNPATKKLNKNIVSTVPPNIRSSYAYKRTKFLDLQCIFENLGSPQLFLTFTCIDTSEDFQNLLGNDRGSRPWIDPVLFALHFKRKWHYFFQNHIMKSFAQQIGGIRDYSYVMEVQDRGSPHIHLVLWCVKSVQELIDQQVVHTWFPEGTSVTGDPLMHSLVQYQIHRCNIR